MNTTKFNGNYGCPYCLNPGSYNSDGKKMCYSKKFKFPHTLNRLDFDIDSYNTWKASVVLIDFGDLDNKYLIFIEKAYKETETFTIKAVLLNTPLNNSTTIKIERYSMEIDFKNEYQGCFFDRFPYQMHDFVYVNKLIMNNKFCQEFCGFYGVNFSSTFNGDTCSYGNNFGSYNGPKYKIKFDKRCVGVQSDICRGRVFKPYSVFISERSNLNLKILTTIIGYNRRKIFTKYTV
ncbi:unnamed protein product [Brachionus calyciflorus]|uniref:Uncharacterized protein n=1 Tax=Brachionus calyciflorus TaxID=104777 RepID=A0A814CJT7_9BILA|nr:unnamed protein product [Brachionus calyciflorus]